MVKSGVIMIDEKSMRHTEQIFDFKLSMSNFKILYIEYRTKNQPIRLPGLILRLRSGQTSEVCPRPELGSKAQG